MGYFECPLAGNFWGHYPSKMPFSHTCWHNPTQHLLVGDTSLLFISYLLQQSYRIFALRFLTMGLIFSDFSAFRPKFV